MAKGARSNVVPLHGIAESEDALALMFERERIGQFVFDHASGKWLVWTGQVWRTDSTQAAFDAIRTHCRVASGAPIRKASTVKGVEMLIRSSRGFARDMGDFDRDPMLLGTPGGTVDLRTGKMRTADPADMITCEVVVAPQFDLPVRWLQFLSEVTGGDAETIRFLQQLAGYCLTGDIREQKVFFIFGDGGTGKSTFVNTLSRLLSTYAKIAPMETFAASHFERHATEIAMLAGARLVTANETEKGRKWAAARIKSLSGGDPITARFMRQDYFTFAPTFKLLFVGNHAPSFQTVDEAMQRRFYVIPFDIKPERRDETLPEALERELPQILGWAVAGCLDWQHNGLQVSPKVRDATDAYFQEQDLFGQWLAECVTKHYKTSTPKAEALTRWNAFRQREGELPETAKQFSETMRRAGFKEGQETTGARRRLWLGLEVQSPTHPGGWT